MLIYQSGLTSKVIREYRKQCPSTRLNVLLSFGIYGNERSRIRKILRPGFDSLILDSGVWSLNNQNFEPDLNITLETYRDYIEEFGRYYDFYFNFDEDFSKNGFAVNNHNLIQLENAGLNPVPVIRDIFGPEVNYYINKGYKRIAIGSSAVVNTSQVRNVVTKLYGHEIQVHLFGTTWFKYLVDSPVYSCDSSTWSRTAGSNQILYWNPEKSGRDKKDVIFIKGKVSQPGKNETDLTQYDYRDECEEYLWENLGLRHDNLLGFNGPVNRQLVNVHFFAELERRITENHLQHGWPY